MGEEHDEWLKDRETMEAEREVRHERERHFHLANDVAKKSEEEARRKAEAPPRAEEDEEEEGDIEQYTDDEAR